MAGKNPDTYRCKECGHALTDMHDKNGCRVIDILTGEKCKCTKAGRW